MWSRCLEWRSQLKNEVRSLLVVSKVPIEMAQTFALDTNSRSSVVAWHGYSASGTGTFLLVIDMAPEPEKMLALADAALVIGDPALRLRLKMDALQAKVPRADGAEGCCCCGGDDEQPIQGVETLFIYDIAQQWREMTGLPCVLALWVARRGAITPEILADFQGSREYGLAHIGDIAEGAALKLELPPRELENLPDREYRFLTR